MKTDNELIAEFMDIKVEEYNHYLLGKGMAIVKEDGCIDWPQLDFYNPDKSWDWLMPVVEKIDSLGHDIDIFWHSNMRDGNETRHAICAIQDRPPFKPVTYTEGAPMINCVYKAVVDFIKWHNSQQK